MRKKNKKSFPRFKSIQDEARYWEKHSIAPHWASLEDARSEIKSSKLSNWLLIEMDNITINKLNQVAHKKHQTLKNLTRKWIHSLAS